MKKLMRLGALRRNRGASLVTAIFLVVVLAGLGAAMVSLSTMQQTSSALDVMGARAYQAARAGVEYGLYRQQVNTSCPASVNLTLPAGSLSIFTVTVQCTATATVIPGTFIYQVKATACNQPAGGACPNAASTSGDYVQRVVQAQFQSNY
ncbi:MAG TPA: agglutinin biogenesis protein MshP [Janthinobacterium sp.]|nr:agglutinin biogenesis protein MshP [Janthinobacterium sp.]